MPWITIIPLVIQGLSAIQPLASGVNSNKISAAGAGLVPVLEQLLVSLAPGSQAKVGLAVSAATSVFDPDIVKWIQNVLNLAGNSLTVDGQLGPMTLAAADTFAAKELGIVPGGLVSEILQKVETARGHATDRLADRRRPIPPPPHAPRHARTRARRAPRSASPSSRLGARRRRVGTSPDGRNRQKSGTPRRCNSSRSGPSAPRASTTRSSLASPPPCCSVGIQAALSLHRS